MKRNMDLIRLLLLRAEGDTEIDLSEYDNPTLWYHRNLLLEAKYAVGPKAQSGNGTIVVYDLTRLTPEGHNLLDSFRSEGVWEKLEKKTEGFSESYPLQSMTDAVASIIQDSIR